MAGYAAAMDASMSEGSSTQDVTAAIASGSSSLPEMLEPQEGPSGIGRPPEDWESQAGEELENASLSMCVSEATCKKSRGEEMQIIKFMDVVAKLAFVELFWMVYLKLGFNFSCYHSDFLALSLV